MNNNGIRFLWDISQFFILALANNDPFCEETTALTNDDLFGSHLGKGPHECAVHSHQLLVSQHVPLIQDNPDLGRKKSYLIVHSKNKKRLFSFPIFHCEGGRVQYTGCGNTEHRGLKARAPP